MLISYLGLNTEGRYSGMLMIDEAASVFKSLFSPSCVMKPGSSGDHFLPGDFLVSLYNGTQISNETKDSYKSGLKATIEEHGLNALMCSELSNTFTAMAINPDEIGALFRIHFVLGERRFYDPSNDQINACLSPMKALLREHDPDFIDVTC
jgi:hypothetical protein